METLRALRSGVQSAGRSVRTLAKNKNATSEEKKRFPLLGAYDLCLKCSHFFNILDARGAISVTERVGVIARVRALAVGIAKAWVDQQGSEKQLNEIDAGEADDPAPVAKKHQRKPHPAPVA